MAWLSDQSGEYKLILCDLETCDQRAIALNEHPSFYFEPSWSPDNSKVVLTDKRNQLIVVDSEDESAVIADRDGLSTVPFSMSPTFSADSRYIAYTKNLPTRMRTLYIYDTETHRVHQAADGMSDIVSPVWSSDGLHIFLPPVRTMAPGSTG